MFARQNTATQVFDRWTGDVQYLLDPLAPYTTLVMPDADVRLRATYRTVPAWTAKTGTFNSIPVTYYVPPNPVGLIFHFHGTGGTGQVLFESAEFLSVTRDFVAAGFAVAAFDCANRTTGQWDTATTGAGDELARGGDLLRARVSGIVGKLYGSGGVVDGEERRSSTGGSGGGGDVNPAAGADCEPGITGAAHHYGAHAVVSGAVHAVSDLDAG